MPELEGLTYEEILKEMQLTTLKERRERGDLITIYKLNNLEETVTKDLILRRKGEAGYFRENKKRKNCKKELAWTIQKVQFSPEKYRYLEWTEGRGDNGKECTTTNGTTVQI